MERARKIPEEAQMKRISAEKERADKRVKK
jgi:hypothetical protein